MILAGPALAERLLPSKLYGRSFRFLAPFSAENLAAAAARRVDAKLPKPPCVCCAETLPPRRTTYCSGVAYQTDGVGGCASWWASMGWGDPDNVVRLVQGDRCAICALDFRIVEPVWKAAIERIYRDNSWRPLPTRGVAMLAADRIGHPRLAVADVASRLGEIDHIVPLVLGGSNLLSNLRLLCAPCHKEVTAGLSAMMALNRRAARSAEEGPLFQPATMTPNEFLEHLKTLSNDAVHELWVSGPHRDRTLVTGYLCALKSAKRYGVPRISSMALFEKLTMTAYEEFGSLNPGVRALVEMRDQAKRGVFVGGLYVQAQSRLFALYADAGQRAPVEVLDEGPALA